jgi:hypothetical protein
MEQRGKQWITGVYNGSRHTIILPAGFLAGSNSNNISIGAILNNGVGAGGYASIEDANITATTFIVACWTPPTATYLSWIAIGRWKA